MPEFTPNVAGFMAEYKAATWSNPLDPSMRVWSWADEKGERLPMILTDVREDREIHGVHLQTILSGEKQHTGTASEVLKEITALADKHHVPISLFPKAFGTVDSPLSTKNLIAWYKRHGWVKDKNYRSDNMIRHPLGAKTASNSMRPGIRRVRDAVFYWATDHPVPDGFVVPQARPRQAEVERIFEEVRKETNPSAPSRLSCVFVCPMNGRGFCSGRMDRKYVYKVRVTGTVFLTDGGYFTEAIFRFRERGEEGLRGWAESYWEVSSNVLNNHAEEVLVDGVVRVERLMNGDDSMERVAARHLFAGGYVQEVGPSPLKYRNGGRVLRLLLTDTSAPPRPPGKDSYFGDLDPHAVAFLDFHALGQDGWYIDYMNTRRDVRGQKHARMLVEAFYERYVKPGQEVNWGQMMEASVGTLWKSMKAKYPEVSSYGKVYW